MTISRLATFLKQHSRKNVLILLLFFSIYSHGQPGFEDDVQDEEEVSIEANILVVVGFAFIVGFYSFHRKKNVTVCTFSDK